MRKTLGIAGLLVLVPLSVALALLGEAHFEIRNVEASLPELPELQALARTAAGPVRVSYVNTASQRGGGTIVGHPVFVLEWADGRLFLIDAGMDRESARSFGLVLEWALGADPVDAKGAFPAQVGDAVHRVAGLGLTHLHSDHTQGLIALCRARGRSLPLYQTPWQSERANFTTWAGLAHIDASGCVRPRRLERGPPFAIPEFPGLAAIHVGGHTPGSTVFAAHVKGVTWVFAGDVTNFRSELIENRPKPWLYSHLIVPESVVLLERLRAWLAALDARPDFRVVPSHDQEAWRTSGLCPYPGCPGD